LQVALQRRLLGEAGRRGIEFAIEGCEGFHALASSAGFSGVSD
jgi:hypothetical protein